MKTKNTFDAYGVYNNVMANRRKERRALIGTIIILTIALTLVGVEIIAFITIR